MLKTFRIGGIHPPENKISAAKSIEVLPLPKQVSILVSQHIGAPATVLVKKGDDVKVGSLSLKPVDLSLQTSTPQCPVKS